MVFNASIATSILGSALGTSQNSTYQPVTIDTNTLLAASAARANVNAALSGPRQLSGASSFDPASVVEVTPPWDYTVEQASSDDLLTTVLAGNSFLDATTLNGFSDSEASDDIKKLFAVHEALDKLLAVASAAADDDTSITDARRSFLDKRFQSGLEEVSSFLSTKDQFEDLGLLFGEERSFAKGSVPVITSENVFETKALWTGELNAEATTLANAGAFTLTVTELNESPVAINVDLADMTETKSMDNIAAFINDKLSTAGFNTRFSRIKIGEEDEDGVIQGDSYGFKITGDDRETLNFSAAASSPALFIGGTSGGTTGGGDNVLTTAEAAALTKITNLSDAAPTLGSTQRTEATGGTVDVEKTTTEVVDGDTTLVTTTESQTEMSAARIAKTVAGPNGEVFALLEYEGTLDAATSPLGTKDIALARYDSSGRQLWSRSLGAADSAEGLALAVGGDGTVAVGGSISGAFGTSVDLGGTDALVTSYTSDGDLNFTQRMGTIGDDAVTALAVDDAGMIYAGGSVSGSLGGASFAGEKDGFIRALNSDGSTAWTQTLGGAGNDRVDALAVSGGDLIVGAVQDDVGSVSKYATADGSVDAGYSVDLGTLDSGDIAGIAIDPSDGAVYVAGAARSGFTAPANTNQGGRDGYLMRITSTADATVEYANFIGGSAEDRVNGIAVSNGEVYLVGATKGSVGSGTQVGTEDAFVSKLDGATGTQSWTSQFSGLGGLAGGNGVAVVAGGSSALDAFGLPQGDLAVTDSREVTERTPAKVGDYFQVRIDGLYKRTITLEEGDSMRALAFATDLALGVYGDASSSQANGGSVLNIKPREGVTLELIAGGEGQDLLAALGITEGPVIKEADDDEDAVETFGLNLTGIADLTTETSATSAVKTIEDAMSAVRRAYRTLTRDPALDDLLDGDKGAGDRSGTVPEYLTTKLANYQAALSRLGG